MLPQRWSVKNTPEGKKALKKAMEQLLEPEQFEDYMSRYHYDSNWTTFCYPNFSTSFGYRSGNHTGAQRDWPVITPEELLAGLEPEQLEEPIVINNYSIF